jgi:hypothetical protein
LVWYDDTMSTTLDSELQARADKLVEDLRPLIEATKPSIRQWKEAKALAQLPDDENLPLILLEVSAMTGLSMKTIMTRREVGLAFPNPHPDVAYGVYVELLGARPEDRDLIWVGDGGAERFCPENLGDWTIEAMRCAVRGFYTGKDRFGRAV